jgi:hypothetical protein
MSRQSPRPRTRGRAPCQKSWLQGRVRYCIASKLGQGRALAGGAAALAGILPALGSATLGGVQVAHTPPTPLHVPGGGAERRLSRRWLWPRASRARAGRGPGGWGGVVQGEGRRQVSPARRAAPGRERVRRKANAAIKLSTRGCALGRLRARSTAKVWAAPAHAHANVSLPAKTGDFVIVSITYRRAGSGGSTPRTPCACNSRVENRARELIPWPRLLHNGFTIRP